MAGIERFPLRCAAYYAHMQRRPAEPGKFIGYPKPFTGTPFLSFFVFLVTKNDNALEVVRLTDETLRRMREC